MPLKPLKTRHLRKNIFMKCICCQKNLSDFESTRRHAMTNEFLDTCTGCLGEIQRMTPLPTKDRQDLEHNEEYLADVDNMGEYNEL